jgi:hypothetical protein
LAIYEEHLGVETKMNDPTLSVTRLFYDDETKVPSQNEVVNPSWQEIRNALSGLDGTQRSTVIIGHEDPELNYLACGGGANGQYRCFAVTKDGDEVTLVNPEENSTDVIEVFMGQKSRVPKSHCVSIDDVIKAAFHYAQTSSLDPCLAWQ